MNRFIETHPVIVEVALKRAHDRKERREVIVSVDGGGACFSARGLASLIKMLQRAQVSNDRIRKQLERDKKKR